MPHACVQRLLPCASLTRPGTQREWLAAQEEQRARVCGLKASLAQLAARRSAHHDAPETPVALAALTDGGDDSGLAAKYRHVKAAARAAAARVAQLQGALCACASVAAETDGYPFAWRRGA